VIRESIAKLIDGNSLLEEEAAAVMGEIMSGSWTVLRVETLSLGAVLRWIDWAA
jgi:anthranilate phosphoribosyltransferase